jgi:hypothetical protein
VYSLDGMLVTKDTPVRLFLRPTSITVHNDCHMLWYAIFVDVFKFHTDDFVYV